MQSLRFSITQPSSKHGCFSVSKVSYLIAPGMTTRITVVLDGRQAKKIEELLIESDSLYTEQTSSFTAKFVSADSSLPFNAEGSNDEENIETSASIKTSAANSQGHKIVVSDVLEIRSPINVLKIPLQGTFVFRNGNS